MTSATTNFKARWETLRATEKRPCPRCAAPGHKVGMVALVMQQWLCENGHKWRMAPPQTKRVAIIPSGPKPLCRDGTMKHHWLVEEGRGGMATCRRCGTSWSFDAVGEGPTEDFRTYRPQQTALGEEGEDAGLQ